MLTPKSDELVADPFRHHGKQNAEKFFESGFSNVFKRIRDVSSMEYPMSIFYAYKQSEIDSAGTQTYTGWDTLLEGIISSGWAITATWPVTLEPKCLAECAEWKVMP